MSDVTSSRWRVIEPLLDAALELPAERRRAYLDDACGGDAALRDEIERMAAECNTPDDALDRPAARRFAALLDDAEPPSLPNGLRAIRELGRGGMATVYLAHDEKHERDVAVKVLHPEVGAVLGTMRFLAEIRVTANLRHPHILPLFDSGEHAGRLYYVMLHAEGGSLRERLSLDGVLTPDHARRIGVQIADALVEAHARGVVHRDIKPENILLTRDGTHAYLADFGIALAFGGSGGGRVTRSGFVLGTRDYMSPEQTRGVPDLDGRSDVYSLGCVLYEMLTGALPGPSDTSARDTLAERVDPVTCDAVLRAIAPARERRFATAAELARALERTTADAPPRASAGRWRRATAVAAVAAIAVGAAVAGVAGVRAWRDGAVVGTAAGEVDPDAIAVLPFRHEAGAGGAMLSGDNCARLLYDRLGRWQELALSDEMRVADARRARGPAELTLDDARALARRVGAGRFVWGSVSARGDGGMRVSAALYDRRRSRPITHVVYVPAHADVDAKLAELADSLVVALAGTPAVAVPAGAGTRHFDALKHYADGYAALHAWNGPAAERHFEAATAIDPSFAEASFALAQSMSWSGRHEPAAWREPAARAVSDSIRLGMRDRALAGALLALAEQRPQDACARYRGLVARDPRDFAAHFGLGECLSRDRVVLRDASSPTGWRFRASVAEAVRAYTTALRLVPSYFEAAQGSAFAALAGRVLPTDDGYFRLGHASAPTAIQMGAFPELLGDTVAYRPVPLESLFRGAAPPTHRAGLARNRETLRALTARWTTAFPRSAPAWHAHALALEAVGALDAARGAAPGASSAAAAAEARRLVRADRDADPGAAARAGATHARVLLKLGRVAEARAVAEAALADTVRLTPSGHGAEVLAALAALTGRARLAARLHERAAADTSTAIYARSMGVGPRPPAPVLQAAATFAAYAALAAPADSVRAAHARAERAIERWTPPGERARTRVQLLTWSSLVAQPALGASALGTLRDTGGEGELLSLWTAVARGDAAAARRMLAARRPPVAGHVAAPDWLVQASHAALAIRDTATAVRLLDELTATLADQPARLTEEVSAAASLGRGLVLRARLGGAAAARDARLLWAAADPELRAMVGALPDR